MRQFAAEQEPAEPHPNTTNMRIVTTILSCLLLTLSSVAQKKFYNLTADDVRIDSVLPCVRYDNALSYNFNDSTYTLDILYPEFIDMAGSEIAAYRKLMGDALPPALPLVDTYITQTRKVPHLTASFCPVVFRDGRYQFLVSFMLEEKAAAKHANNDVSASHDMANAKATTPLASTKEGATAASRYAEHSVLATGKWAKIRVSETGIHELTADVARRAGFSDFSKVKVYGYGGNLVPEILTDSYLRQTDDLQEIATCTVGGKRLFFADGPVSWSSSSNVVRTRNPYSNYGYYFLTESDGAPLTCKEDDILAQVASSNNGYHYLYEKDEFAWYHGGRNLYEGASIPVGETKSYKIDVHETEEEATISVYVTANTATTGEIYLNDKLKGKFNIQLIAYDKGNGAMVTFTEKLSQSNTVKIKTLTGSPVHLDYIDVTMATQRPVDINGAFPKAEYVHNITNQDLHADNGFDMVIIIPTSQNTLKQAERLKAHHEQHDGMSVRIVPADELYNEFSSGTPDASAYKRYMKMLYDKAETADKAPRYLLLFGDASFDNRMLTTDMRNASPDNYLLCFESENSFNEKDCHVSDDFLAYLDDNESMKTGDYFRATPDVAVGRFTCTTADQAKVFVDKTINYATGSPSGNWQNTIMFLGDDGNKNLHMKDVNNVADNVIRNHPGYYVRKVMWDAYKRESSSTGHRYPEATKIIKQQQAAGALIIDYAGHGSQISISHEAVLLLNDFIEFRGSNLPLWITASCDIMPFDSNGETIGEAAVLNPNGGAVAFYGTTRTVLASYNNTLNREFINNILSYDAEGKPMTIGEANRLAKVTLVNRGTDITVNKLHYTLIGDPALALALPTRDVIVEEINDEDVTKAKTIIKAGEVVKVKGHIALNGVKETNFNGLVNALVRDTKETITCKLNDTTPDGADEPFVYTDRTNILFQGSDSIRNGEFTFLFAVPRDINYTGGTGLINLYAVNNEHTLSAHGACEAFSVEGGKAGDNDGIGPSIYCYLNSPDFSYGGTVNSTPFFVAEINDKDGINASGAGIGHDMQLVIDGDIAKTYTLNDNFQFDFGSYTSGQTYYILPPLDEGQHTLRFKAWDIQNNSSTTTLSFNVRKGLTPHIASIALARNPVRDEAQFIISHDRAGAEITVEIEVMDTSGRLLWHNVTRETAANNIYKVAWDLNLDSGARMHTGVYLYRVRVSSEGSSWASKSKKMIVVR